MQIVVVLSVRIAYHIQTPHDLEPRAGFARPAKMQGRHQALNTTWATINPPVKRTDVEAAKRDYHSSSTCTASKPFPWESFMSPGMCNGKTSQSMGLDRILNTLVSWDGPGGAHKCPCTCGRNLEAMGVGST